MKLAIALLAVLLLASPVTAQTPAEAFEEAQATYTADDAAFAEVWALYTASVSAPERLTLINDLERIAAKGQDDAHAIRSRACFAPWLRANVAMWDMLVELVANLRTDEMLPQEDVERGGLYIDMLRSPHFAALFECEK